MFYVAKEPEIGEGNRQKRNKLRRRKLRAQDEREEQEMKGDRRRGRKEKGKERNRMTIDYLASLCENRFYWIVFVSGTKETIERSE